MSGLASGDLHPIAPSLAGTRFTDVRWVDETGSTNADVLAAAAAGASEGLVVVADHQTQGRGRLDRRWEAAPGSALLASALLRPSLAGDRISLCTLAMAMAAVDACDRVAGVRPGLKWPNDLVVDGRKLAGVLAEATVEGGTVTAVAVGVGLNVRSGAAPADLAPAAVSLEDLTERPLESGVLLVALLRALDRWWGAVVDGDGAAAELVAAARAASATLGRRVRVERPSGVLQGLAVDLDEDGHLVVEDDAGRHTVAAGDVTHLRPA